MGQICKHFNTIMLYYECHYCEGGMLITTGVEQELTEKKKSFVSTCNKCGKSKMTKIPYPFQYSDKMTVIPLPEDVPEEHRE